MWDFAVIIFTIGAGVLGFMLGRNTAPIEYVYVKDDGEGGIQPAPEFDPDKPQPGDMLYPPSEWMSYS